MTNEARILSLSSDLDLRILAHSICVGGEVLSLLATLTLLGPDGKVSEDSLESSQERIRYSIHQE